MKRSQKVIYPSAKQLNTWPRVWALLTATTTSVCPVTLTHTCTCHSCQSCLNSVYCKYSKYSLLHTRSFTFYIFGEFLIYTRKESTRWPLDGAKSDTLTFKCVVDDELQLRQTQRKLGYLFTVHFNGIFHLLCSHIFNVNVYLKMGWWDVQNDRRCDVSINMFAQKGKDEEDSHLLVSS